jgi:hypothetical protein
MPETIAPARPGASAQDEPAARECLRCYLGRMLTEHGCDNTRRWTERWRDRRAPADERLLDELADRGGLCCDCEVVMNVWEDPGLGYDESEADIVPPCAGTGNREPLKLCAHWAGWELREPGDDYEDDESEEYWDDDLY